MCCARLWTNVLSGEDILYILIHLVTRVVSPGNGYCLWFASVTHWVTIIINKSTL